MMEKVSDIKEFGDRDKLSCLENYFFLFGG